MHSILLGRTGSVTNVSLNSYSVTQLTTHAKPFLRFAAQDELMSDDRPRATQGRSAVHLPVRLALASAAVAGALAGGGLALTASPAAPALSPNMSASHTKNLAAPRPLVLAGFGSPDAVSSGS